MYANKDLHNGDAEEVGNDLTTSFSWSFLEQAGSRAVALIVQIVLARMLGPEAFGVLAILLVIVNIADVIAQSGLGTALIQKKDAGEVASSTSFWLSLSIAIVMYVVVFFLAPLVSEFYQMSELTIFLRAIALTLIFNSMNSIQRSLLQKRLDFKSLFKANITASVLSGIVGIVFAFVGAGIWALVIQSVAQSAFMCIALFVIGKWLPQRAFSRNEAGSLFSYGWKISATGILDAFYYGLSELVIGKVCDPASLGLYSQGRKYPMAIIATMTNAIANVLFPKFSSLADDPQRLKMEIRRALKLGTFIIAPISLMSAVVAEPLVIILFTEKWLGCVPIFQLCCIANSLLMLQLVNLRAYMALGHSGLYLRLQIWKVAIGLVVNIATVVLTENIVMTAFATCIANMLLILAVDLYPAKKVLGYQRSSQLKDVFRTYVAAIVGAAISSLAMMPIHLPGLALMVALVVFAVVFLLCAKLLRMEEPRETLVVFRNILKRLPVNS